MIKLFKNTYFLLFLISFLIFIIYLPTLNFFVEGDDFLFLWHIRVPVGFINVPFYNWDQPVAGRYGYGQAWYGALIYNLFGFQAKIFYLSGILVKIIATFSVYFFTKKLARKKIIAILSALIFALTSIGLYGQINFFLQFVLLFISILFISITLFLEGLEQKKYKKVFLGSLLLLIGVYMYVIRAAGISLLPLFTALRFKLFKKRKDMLLGVVLAAVVVLSSAIMISKFISGANNMAVSTLIESSLSIINDAYRGNYEHIRTFFVSISLMLMPVNFYSLIDQAVHAGYFPLKYLQTHAMLFWFLIVFMFVYPFYLFRKINKIFLLSVVSFGVFWNLILIYLTKSGILIYYGGEVVAVTLGLQLFFIGIILGLIYLKTQPEIGATLLSVVLAAIVFYIPNWLHDPVIVSAAESRYFTVSSGFVSIFFAVLIYTIFNNSFILSKSRRFFLSAIFFNLGILFSVVIFLSHLNNINKIITEIGVIRREDIIISHWNYVKSKIDFTKKPLVVVVWSDGDINNVKVEFFKDETLGLIANFPYDFYLSEHYKLFFSYEDAMKTICDWDRKGINLNYQNFYEFHITDNRKISDWSDKGRQRIQSWKKYCNDNSQKGIEVGVN